MPANQLALRFLSQRRSLRNGIERPSEAIFVCVSVCVCLIVVFFSYLFFFLFLFFFSLRRVSTSFGASDRKGGNPRRPVIRLRPARRPIDPSLTGLHPGPLFSYFFFVAMCPFFFFFLFDSTCFVGSLPRFRSRFSGFSPGFIFWFVFS